MEILRMTIRKRAHAPLCLVTLMALVSCASAPPAVTGAAAERAIPEPPSVMFGDFYGRVALTGLFEDSKQWADATPERAPSAILERYRRVDPDSPAALQAFLSEEFVLDPPTPVSRPPTPGLPLSEHIAELWPLLTRRSVDPAPYSSRLPLPHPYVVPGGRFREIYYWDSYFTMLGFGPEQAALKRDMVANFAYLIRTYGHIPNGSRSYYLSRSQPPFFFRMVALLDPQKPAEAFAEYLPELKAEYAFWMQGGEEAEPGSPVRRAVRMPDGSLLNRYWDARNTPRDESYREDVAIAQAVGDDESRIYRDIRAAAESGWDFSSRWFADGETLRTIQTTSIVPVDLNSLLYGLERAIEQGCRVAGEPECVEAFAAKAAARQEAVQEYLWNEASGVFDDWHWREARRLGHVTAATLYPLFVGIATDVQGERVAEVVRKQLVSDGGLVTTRRNTGEQWDAPNGWAPLQWIAVTGLRRYGQPKLAETIARRWLAMVSAVYERTGKLLEKYNVVTLMPGGGGEYALQDGFGWTNGVTVGLLRLYPEYVQERAPALENGVEPH